MRLMRLVGRLWVMMSICDFEEMGGAFLLSLKLFRRRGRLMGDRRLQSCY